MIGMRVDTRIPGVSRSQSLTEESIVEPRHSRRSRIRRVVNSTCRPFKGLLPKRCCLQSPHAAIDARRSLGVAYPVNLKPCSSADIGGETSAPDRQLADDTMPTRERRQWHGRLGGQDKLLQGLDDDAPGCCIMVCRARQLHAIDSFGSGTDQGGLRPDRRGSEWRRNACKRSEARLQHFEWKSGG